jgi:hypothetical protein
MRSKEDLIYGLIFSDRLSYYINISDYIEDVDGYEKFIDEIKKILKKSKVSIVSEKISSDDDGFYWNIKVRKS